MISFLRRQLQQNRKGMSLFEVMIAMGIVMVLIGAVVTYFLFALKTSGKTEAIGQASSSANYAVFFIEKQIENAEALYAETNRLYVKVPVILPDYSIERQWKVFVFEPSGLTDSLGRITSGKLYYYKQDGYDTVPAFLPKQLITDKISVMEFELPGGAYEFKNIVHLTLGYYRDDQLITRHLYVNAASAVVNREQIDPNDLPAI